MLVVKKCQITNTQYNKKCNKHNFDLFKVPNEKTIEFKATKRKQTFALSANLPLERTQPRELTLLILQKTDVSCS